VACARQGLYRLLQAIESLAEHCIIRLNVVEVVMIYTMLRHNILRSMQMIHNVSRDNILRSPVSVTPMTDHPYTREGMHHMAHVRA
jgi:hypothetical protein